MKELSGPRDRFVPEGKQGWTEAGFPVEQALANLCATYATFFDSLNRLFRIYYATPLRRFLWLALRESQSKN
jgi:hypothetical protein